MQEEASNVVDANKPETAEANSANVTTGAVDRASTHAAIIGVRGSYKTF